MIKATERYELCIQRNGRFMDKGKLNEIGGKLDVRIEDIRGMKDERHKKKYLYPFLLAVVGGIAALMGCLKSGNGSGNEASANNTTGTYPYIIPSFIGIMGVGMVFRINKNRKKHLILVLSAVAMLITGIFLLFKGSGLVEAAEDVVRNGNDSGNFNGSIIYAAYSLEQNT